MNKSSLAKAAIYAGLYLFTSGILASTFLLTKREFDNFSLLRAIIIFFSAVLLLKYTFYMFVSPWYEIVMARNRKKKTWIAGRFEPRVSIIVPAWNEEVGLLATIKTLLASSYRNMEIVVVNDGSTDSSDQLMQSFINKYERETRDATECIDIVYHYKQNGGKGVALNTGIGLSSGEIIVSIDADCIVQPDAIKNFVYYFRDTRVMAAVGNVKIGNTKTLIGVIQYLEYLFSFYFKKADSMLNTIYIIGGAAGAFRRDVFEKIGMYSTKNITEDIELSVRIQEAGMRIAYAPDVILYTEGASDLKGLMKQRLRWKRGRFETFKDHKNLFFSCKKRHNKLLTWFVLPLATFGDIQLSLELFFLLFLYLFSLFSHDFTALLSGVLVVSFVFFMQIFDDKRNRKAAFFLLAPIGWLLFYLTTLVEVNALFRSLWGMCTRRELKWQAWQRKGAIDGP